MSINLNDDQRDAVKYFGIKPLLIEAGPGSGKTRVLIERIKFLINEKGLDPSSFLVITFTRKAAKELQDRLSEYYSKDIIDEMKISTIHSFCLELLNEHDSRYTVLDDNFNLKKNVFIYSNRKKLGFKDYATLTMGKVEKVIEAFDKYITYNVDTQGLVNYLEENLDISQEYKDLVDDTFKKDNRFPKIEIDLDKNKRGTKKYKGFNISWNNALHIQTAKAYPKYLELLDEYNLLDYGVMQNKALNILKENPKTKYKNILIDEFQDTDPVQIRIFEILLNEILKENSKKEIINGTFTVVGDIDQSIYGFRGAQDDYFEYLESNYDDVTRLALNKNYRSTNEIINFSENYIKHQRINSKKNLEGDRDASRDIYYLENETREEESQSLLKLIKNLKENNIIKNYNEIAILFRSVKNNSKEIIRVLKGNGIPYQTSGLSDLEDRDEYKYFLILLHFLVSSNNLNSSDELDWLNITAFTDSEFEKPIFNLSNETKTIFNNIWENYKENLVNTMKQVFLEVNGKKSRIRQPSGFFRLEYDLRKKVSMYLKKPILTPENLKLWGITNTEDLKFFNKLFDLKRWINTKSEYTTLDVYYKLLEIGEFLDYNYVINPENKESLVTFGFISNILYDFENISDNHNLKGLYYFLLVNMRNCGKDVVNEDGIHLMTIHKVKGLEFPVVIVAGLNEDNFPKDYKDPSTISSDLSYVPSQYLRYKNDEYSDEIRHYSEEERVIYVAMTRAKDILILSKDIIYSKKSNNKGILKKLKSEINLLTKCLDEINKLNYKELSKQDKRTITKISKELCGVIIPYKYSMDKYQINKNSYIDEYVDKILSYLKTDDDKKEENKLFKLIRSIISEKQEKFDDLKLIKTRLDALIESSDFVKKIDILEEDTFKPDLPNKPDLMMDPEKIVLSYSSIEKYESCPLNYSLSYNYGFKNSDNYAIIQGNLVHNSLEEINNIIISNKNKRRESGEIVDKLSNNEFISEYEIREIVSEIFDQTPNIEDKGNSKEDLINKVLNYWSLYGQYFEILETEYPFEVELGEFILKGFIDLIYKTDNGIAILDYKTSNMNKKSVVEKSELFDKYKKQLYTYALGLKDNWKYCNVKVEKVQIYPILSEDILEFEINDDLIENRKNDIVGVANKIYNEEFPKTEFNLSKCKHCVFKFICDA